VAIEREPCDAGAKCVRRCPRHIMHRCSMTNATVFLPFNPRCA
jgi:hypothetical protein